MQQGGMSARGRLEAANDAGESANIRKLMAKFAGGIPVQDPNSSLSAHALTSVAQPGVRRVISQAPKPVIEKPLASFPRQKSVKSQVREKDALKLPEHMKGVDPRKDSVRFQKSKFAHVAEAERAAKRQKVLSEMEALDADASSRSEYDTPSFMCNDPEPMSIVVV